MSLVLSMREGDDFYVANVRFVLREVHAETRFDLYLPSTKQLFKISEKEAINVLPDVFISAGDRGQSGIARVAIDAPRSILILRGDSYRAQQRETA